MNKTYELYPKYDRTESFHGKAHIIESKDTLHLVSYETHVAKIQGGKASIMSDVQLSATTVRHIKEFFRQNDIPANTKQQLIKDYQEVAK
jgi:hypothetical protein